MIVEANYTEPNYRKKNTGWIEVICGCMFSGKTEELIRRLNRALIAKQKVEIFKPKTDTRYHPEHIVSHDEKSIRSTPVEFSNDILLFAGNCDVIGIDEAQFFDKELAQVANTLANKGKRVVVAGLDMDFKGVPFEPMSQLLSVAEIVTKMHAICVKCGALASYSYRTSLERSKILLGERDKYEARCRKCFLEGQIHE